MARKAKKRRQKTPLQKQEARMKKTWGQAVRLRDRRCMICGRTEGKLDAHHKIEKSLSKYYAYDIDNGITLCFQCHRGNSKNAAHRNRSVFNERMEQYAPEHWEWYKKKWLDVPMMERPKWERDFDEREEELNEMLSTIKAGNYVKRFCGDCNG